MAKSPAALLIDSTGNYVTVVQDGSAYRLVVQTKVVNTDGNYINPALDRTSANAPFSFRLSDGSNFYDAAKSSQLPASLVGGRLDANVGSWLGSTAPTVGQKASSSSLPVVIASDQSRLPVATELQLDYDSGGGVQQLSIIGLALPKSGGAVAGGTASDPIRTDPTGTTAQPISDPAEGTPGATAPSLAIQIAGTDGTNLRVPLVKNAAPGINDYALVVRAIGSTVAGPDVNVNGWFGSSAPTVGQKTMAASLPVTMASDQSPINVLAATIPARAAQIINLSFRATDGAIVSGSYKRVITYTIPTGYSAYLIRFTTYQAEVAYSRLVMEKIMATLSVPTNTYTNLSSYTAPQWAAVIEAEVTQAFGAANNITVTMTYTNQDGVGSRTGTFTIPKSSIIGARFTPTLQTGDIGVRSIQNLSAAPSGGNGAIRVYGFIQLAFHLDLSLTAGVYTDYAPAAVPFPEGTVIGIEYAGGTVAKDRYLGALIQLVAS